MNKKIVPITILLLVIGIVIVNFIKTKESDDAIIMEENTKATTNISEIDEPTEEPKIKEGYPAVDFNLTALAGGAVKLSDYRGKKVILNFWATWCPPCKAEMPHMQNFYEKNKDKGVEILAVNLTDSENGYDKIEQFVEDYGLTFPIPLDKNGELGALYRAFTIPTTYFIDSNGIIAKKIIGPMDEGMMENLINEIE